MQAGCQKLFTLGPVYNLEQEELKGQMGLYQLPSMHTLEDFLQLQMYYVLRDLE